MAACMLPTFTCLQIREIEPGIQLLTIDQPNSGANILNKTLFTELDQIMKALATQPGLTGLILFSAKPHIFIAGADLHAIADNLDWPDEQIVKFCEQGRAVMARFSRCPFVTVAAIHGAAVGGGLELPLWCDCRIASDDRRTQLGLPEVKLGLIPGWAGTARLPRLIGFEPAAELIISGRLVSATVAKDLGFVDAVVPESELLTAACQLIRRVKTSESFVHHRRTIMGPVTELGQLAAAVKRLGEQITESREIFAFAPTVALEHLARTATLDQPAAWRSESIAMAQVWGSPASRGLLNHFFLVDRNKKQPGLVDTSLTPTPIKRIGLIGAGVMGRAIAAHCWRRGISILLFDAAPDLAAQVVTELRAENTQSDNSIDAVTDYQSLANVDLVIETVVETLGVKTSVLKQLEAAVAPDTILATNTSAIPISQLATALKHPERFCGIHFCHPELMSLVEVVCGQASAESAVATAVGFVRRLGKMPVAMNDGAGFVVNRLLAAMLDQALRLLTQGVPIEEIDGALREFGFLGGPFEIIDVVGVDTCLFAGRTMWEAGLKCVTLSPILPRMVKLQRLGRKSGVGFYRYPVARGTGQIDTELPPLLASYLSLGDKPISLTPAEIVSQVLSGMVLEATRILDEEIVADFRDIDLCVIHGFSFPQHRGGLLYWADQVGLETINQTLFQIATRDTRWEPSALLKEMRGADRKFYG